MEITISICLGFMLIFAVIAVMNKSMLKSAIALALVSIMLGVVLYLLSAEWAAVFEISVCSGLVTVISVSAISLTNEDKGQLQKKYMDKKRMAILPYILILSGFLLVFIVLTAKIDLPYDKISEPVSDSLSEVLWNSRQADVWGQIIILLTGAFAVVTLFKEA
ncbi:MAG: hypothetical protein GX802_04625 [Clostridiales bacterium]|nr:hypothetical protein [Clostridiales bacterium]